MDIFVYLHHYYYYRKLSLPIPKYTILLITPKRKLANMDLMEINKTLMLAEDENQENVNGTRRSRHIGNRRGHATMEEVDAFLDVLNKELRLILCK